MKQILEKSPISLGPSFLSSSYTTQDQGSIKATLERRFSNALELNPENITALCVYYPQIGGVMQEAQMFISYSASYKTPAYSALWYELITT